MKRLLYMLVATTVAGAAPMPFAAEALEFDDDGDAPSLSDSSDDATTSIAIPALVGDAFAPPSFATLIGVAGDESAPRGTLIVDRERDDIATIHCRIREALAGHLESMTLLDAALHDASERGDLKVRIDDALPFGELIEICRRYHFVYWRTVREETGMRHEFLADLYSARSPHQPERAAEEVKTC